MKRYLFVSGCPRSGTTALATIVNWAPHTFVGQERFNLLFNREPHRFLPSLFEPARIRDFQKFDCGYESFDALPAYKAPTTNPTMLSGIETANVLGDKLISLYQNFGIFDAPQWAEKDVRVVHIIRDVVDVSSSYQARFDNASDNWNQDFVAGVRVWSTSMEKTHDYLLAGGAREKAQVSIINYDSLYTSDLGAFLTQCARIFEVAGLPYGEKERAGLTLLHKDTVRRLETRKILPEFREQVERLVDPSTMRKYRELRDIALA